MRQIGKVSRAQMEQTAEKCAKSYTPKGTAPATAPDHKHPSEIKHEWTTSASSNTAGQDKRPEITTQRGRAAEMGGISETGDRVSSRTVGNVEEIDTGLENNRIGGQSKRTDSRE